MSIGRSYKRLGPCLALLLQLWGFAILAQEGAEVHGRIVDAVTRLPVPFASVYINNTSIGTIADSLGNYALKQVPVQYTDLVFSSLGYESLLSTVALSSGQVLTLDVKLSQSKNFLKETVIKGSRDNRWRRRYEQFFDAFMGSGPNASFCEIVNAGILEFNILPDGTLTASANAPLEIVNRALGYKILLRLQRFEMLSADYKILFYSQYIDLDPMNAKEELRWEVNRLRSYKGSLRHFLKSLIDRRAHEEGFNVYKQKLVELSNGKKIIVRPSDPLPSEVLFPEKVANPGHQDNYKLLRKGTFEIQYLNAFANQSKRKYPDFPHPVSWLEVNGEYLLCPANGILSANSNSFVYGEMSKYRVADLLPFDFDPVPEEGKLYLHQQTVLGSLKGSVTDAVSGSRLAGAHLFINNSLFKTDADALGRFEIKKIPPGVYILVATFGSYPIKSQKIVIPTGGAVLANVRMPGEEANDWTPDFVGDATIGEWLYRDLIKPAFPFAEVANIYVLESKFSPDKIQIRANTPLELEVKKTGYHIRYYLKNVEFTHNGKKRIITGFTSFDTLATDKTRQRERWIENRDELYRGSFSHFVRSLAEGRTSEEGFEIYSPKAGRSENRANSIRSRKRGHSANLVPGDSLLLNDDGQVLRFSLPEKSRIRFEKYRSTKVGSNSVLEITPSGTLLSESNLKLNGPMEKTELHVFPLEYRPSKDFISDPNVWVYINTDEIRLLRQLREKPFLQTDKGYYYPGEKIWYKAYMRYAAQLAKDSLSKVLYVQLITENKKIIKDKVLKIEDGEVWGDLNLPETLEPGHYYLRAYTKWALNFGNEDIFIQPIPILARDENLANDQGTIPPVSPDGLSMTLQPDRQTYKPRDKIIVKIKVSDRDGVLVNSSLSVSVTDAERILRTKLARSILEDSLVLRKDNSKLLRISYPIEKEFGYDCQVNSELRGAPASVVITAIKDKQVIYGRPDAESRFRFVANFYDSASFIFRANLKNGNFAGHVTIHRPTPLPVLMPEYKVALASEHEDIKQRIDHSYDPLQKVTVLDEVLIQGTRIDPPADLSKSTSLLQSPSFAIEGAELNHLAESIQDMDGFMSALASRVAGARYDRADHLLFLRTAGIAGTVGMARNAAVYVENVLFQSLLQINPIEIERVEIFKNVSDIAILGANASNGIVRFIMKKGQDKKATLNQYDRYTLSGYASPSNFFMRDYDKKRDDNALPDLRTTIYWNPDVTTDGAEATISFFAADVPTRYRVTVQGLTDKGKPIYGEQIIEVN